MVLVFMGLAKDIPTAVITFGTRPGTAESQPLGHRFPSLLSLA